MDIGAVNCITVPDLGLLLHKGKQFGCTHAVDADVHGLSVHVLGIGHAALVSVMLGAADGAGSVSRFTKLRPGIVCQFQQRPVGQHREPVAVRLMILPTAAAEFLGTPVLDTLEQFGDLNEEGEFCEYFKQ